MTQRNNILEELQELNSSLPMAEGSGPYAVPVGYFDTLIKELLIRIKALEAKTAAGELSVLSPLLKNISREMPYAVPTGYFESLGESISIHAKAGQSAQEEIENLSPLLSSLKKQAPYSVPAGYFENLVPGKQKHPAKLVPFARRNWMRYAAAAVITGLIVLGGSLFFFKGNKETGNRALTKFTKDVKKMDEQQKENLADFVAAGMDGREVAKNGIKTEEVKQLLQDIPEDELREFEQQTEDLEGIVLTN